MDVRIIGTEPPPGTWGGHDLFVGMPRGAVVEEPQPVMGAGEMEFTGEVEVVLTPDGVDLRGPIVQGRRGSRFLYLTWLAGTGPAPGTGRDAAGAPDATQNLSIVRRATLMLDALDPVELVAGDRAGARLVGRLALTDPDGGPACAAIRPPRIRWTLG